MKHVTQKRRMDVDGEAIYYCFHPEYGRTKLKREDVVDGYRISFLVSELDLELFKRGILMKIPRWIPFGQPLNPLRIVDISIENSPDISPALFSESGDEFIGTLYKIVVEFTIGKLEGHGGEVTIPNEENDCELWMG